MWTRREVIHAPANVLRCAQTRMGVDRMRMCFSFCQRTFNSSVEGGQQGGGQRTSDGGEGGGGRQGRGER
eukprot:6513648-Pyramimonas_sp.AAC.1